jgi:hypothetical protein
MLAAMTSRAHPAALPHGEIREVFPGVFFTTGTMRMAGPIPVRFSRNMTIVREGERLVIVNSVRLTEEGLRRLDGLGKVTDVLRIAGYHGMDDPFYKERYGARIWAVKGQRYTAGFGRKTAEPYFMPDVEMDATTELPLSGAKVYVLGSRPAEGLLLLERAGGILVSGDCLQNWHRTDGYFNLLSKLMMKRMGFIKPHNVGPAWLKQANPPIDELRGILDLGFEHVLPAHGAPVQGGAKEKYRPRIEQLPAPAGSQMNRSD